MATQTTVSTGAFAVIETGGKQYIVSEGQPLKIEKLTANAGETVTFDRVLLLSDASNNVTIGTPYIDGATISATVEVQGKAKKIRVMHFKAKSNRHKTYGHRQPYTLVKIASDSDQTAAPKKAPAAKAAATTEEKPAKKATAKKATSKTAQ